VEGRLSRRAFAAIAGRVLASCAAGVSCAAGERSPQAREGRLAARPEPLAPQATPLAAGSRALGLDDARDALLRMPRGGQSGPIALAVMLHGAGGSAERFLMRVGAAADAAGVAVLAPQSRGQTWDLVRGGFGPDVMFINRALERVFSIASIDPARVSVGGFSDGATYALSLGLINGDLFRKIVAFSPGFVVDGQPQGQPRLFISHGRADTVLPIDRCSRRIVPALQRRGYDVTFREFDGGHEVPSDIAEEAFKWAAETVAGRSPA
jgi:phospholipase/carboxylesterase